MSRPGFAASLAYPLRGLGHLVRHMHLWKYAALPFLVNLIVYTGLLVAFYLLVEHHVIPWMASWLPGWLVWVARVVSYAGAVVLLAFLFTVIGNLIAGPLLDFLAERVLRDLRGRPLPPGGAWYADALRSFGRQALKLAIFCTIQLVLLLLLLLPVVQVIYPVVAALVTIFFLALEYFDYPLGADRLPLSERLSFVLRHRGPSTGLGAALFLMALVPLVSYLALPACVVAATLLYHDITREP